MSNPSSSAGVRARAEQLAEDLRDRGADGELLLSLSEAADHIVCFALAERADALREPQQQVAERVRAAAKHHTGAFACCGLTLLNMADALSSAPAPLPQPPAGAAGVTTRTDDAD